MAVTTLIHPHCPVCETLSETGVASTEYSLTTECEACHTTFTMVHNGNEWDITQETEPRPNVYALLEIPPQKQSVYFLARRRAFDLELTESQYGLLPPTYRQANNKEGLLAWLEQDLVDIVSNNPPESLVRLAGWTIGTDTLPLREDLSDGDLTYEIDAADYVERQETLRASIHELFERVQRFFVECKDYTPTELVDKSNQIWRQWVFLTESPEHLLVVAHHLREEPLDDITITPVPNHTDGPGVTVDFIVGDEHYPITFTGITQATYDQQVFLSVNGLLHCLKDMSNES